MDYSISHKNIMALLYLLPLVLAASLFKVSEAQCLARRSWAPCNYDDVNVLITLARALEESENSRSCRNNIDVEEIIMKLINALVYTTIGNQNGCGGSGGNGGSVSTPNEGLIDLDLLNPNDPDNILKLDLARQKLLGIGLGNTN